MYLLIDIEQMARPVVKNAGRTSLISRFLHFFLNRSLKSFCQELDSFILSLEGSLKHIENLDEDGAMKLLQSTKKTISKMDEIGEELQKVSYFENQNLKEKYIYMQNILYKIEGRLHRITFQNKKKFSSEDSLKRGVIKMNSKYTETLLAK
jgi:hypothetical protein